MEINQSSQNNNLTVKQKKWLKYYIETGNATQVTIKAYHLDPETQYHSAAQIGYENLKKLDIGEMMELMGLTNKVLLQVLTVGIAKPEKSELIINYFDRDLVTRSYIIIDPATETFKLKDFSEVIEITTLPFNISSEKPLSSLPNI